jgi:hypothetical protein
MTLGLGVTLLALGVDWRVRVVRRRRAALGELVRGALRDPNPLARRAAAVVVVGQGLAAVAELLLEAIALERDSSVLDAIAEAVARNQWEPSHRAEVLELRLWAQRRLEERDQRRAKERERRNEERWQWQGEESERRQGEESEHRQGEDSEQRPAEERAQRRAEEPVPVPLAEAHAFLPPAAPIDGHVSAGNGREPVPAAAPPGGRALAQVAAGALRRLRDARTPEPERNHHRERRP